jgi:polyisoprenoid-binding protein YceI
MRSRRRLALIIAAACAAAIALAYGVFVLAGGGSKPRLGLDAKPGGTAALDGEWRIAPASIVGYRVREKLSYLPAPHDAVGRTHAMRGELQIRDRALSRLDVHADLSTLQSDRAERDSVLRTEGPEFARFPDARFRLTGPIGLTGLPARIGRFTASGDLTLHRVTHRVHIPFQAAVHGTTLELAGALPIRFSDYGFEPPKRPIVSIRPTGEIEFRLVFTRAAARS